MLMWNGGNIMINRFFDRRSYALDERALDFTSTASLSDDELRQRLAAPSDVALSRFDYHLVDRRPNGDLVVSAEAFYG